MVLKVKVRHVKAREVKGRKEVGSKVYEYEYFTLPLKPLRQEARNREVG